MSRLTGNFTKIIVLTIFLLPFFSQPTSAMDRAGRLGIGFTTQLTNDLPAISFKLQKSKSFAFSGLFGLDTSDNGGWGAGFKMYKIIFDEPQLNFYAAALGALTSKKTTGQVEQSGFQFDVTFGSEFSFTGLASLGFSFEFGISLNKVNDFAIQTVGHNFLVAGVHFYL